jgi:hypothetical protein
MRALIDARRVLSLTLAGIVGVPAHAWRNASCASGCRPSPRKGTLPTRELPFSYVQFGKLPGVAYVGPMLQWTAGPGFGSGFRAGRDALRKHRRLRDSRVLCKDDGEPITRQDAWSRVRYAARDANVPTGVHILRHYAAFRTMPSRFIWSLIPSL